MRDFSAIRRGFRGACLSGLAALASVACGSDGNAHGATSRLLGQAPHCPETQVLRIEGTVGAGAIDDTRLDNNINAGLENIGNSRFYTPLTTLAPLASNQLELQLGWADSLFYGDTAATTGGSLTLPTNHPDKGKVFCVTKAEVGFVDGGAEDGAFKFAVSEIASDTASGSPSPHPCVPADQKLVVDIRGCYQ